MQRPLTQQAVMAPLSSSRQWQQVDPQVLRGQEQQARRQKQQQGWE